MVSTITWRGNRRHVMHTIKLILVSWGNRLTTYSDNQLFPDLFTFALRRQARCRDMKSPSSSVRQVVSFHGWYPRSKTAVLWKRGFDAASHSSRQWFWWWIIQLWAPWVKLDFLGRKFCFFYGNISAERRHGRIVTVMLPPSLALALFVFAAITLLLGKLKDLLRLHSFDFLNTGMLIGWGWGVAAMASGLAVRSQELLAQQRQEAQASWVFISLPLHLDLDDITSLVEGIPTSIQLQRFIFQGKFLDPRSALSNQWFALLTHEI